MRHVHKEANASLCLHKFCGTAARAACGSTLVIAVHGVAAQCPVFFAPAVHYRTGDMPRSIAVADLSGDGLPDLAVANNVSFTVSVLRGGAGGVFQPATAYPVGHLPNSVAAADFNGDHRLDLAVANASDGNVSILLQAPDGSFPTRVNYAAGGAPWCVAIADFNADGRPDLAVTNHFGGNVSVLLGNANGTFQTRVNFAVDVNPDGMAIGQFTPDSSPDLAVAHTSIFGGSSHVSILLGNPNGTFQGVVHYPVGVNAESVAVADFNADGKNDLAVTNWTSNTVSILLGRGDGTFASGPLLAAGPAPRSVAVADFNGDGAPDLAVVNSDNDSVSIFLGLGGGGFRPKTDFPAGPGSIFVVTGDFNADGKPDLAIADQQDGGSVAVILNTTFAHSLPTITAQPEPGQTCRDETATFSVGAAADGPLTYRWQVESAPGVWTDLGSDPLPLSCGHTIGFGAASDTLHLGIADCFEAGSIRCDVRCIVGNACGTTASAAATLTVCLADVSCDGFLDFFDYDGFVSGFETGGAVSDFNGDGFVDFFDYDAFVGAFEAGC